MKSLTILISISISISILALSGCAGTVKNLRDTDMENGCVAVEAGVKLGYFNQEGEAEVCKVKCSKELPEGFSYKYENTRTGCHIQIGKE